MPLLEDSKLGWDHCAAYMEESLYRRVAPEIWSLFVRDLDQCFWRSEDAMLAVHRFWVSRQDRPATTVGALLDAAGQQCLSALSNLSYMAEDELLQHAYGHRLAASETLTDSPDSMTLRQQLGAISSLTRGMKNQRALQAGRLSREDGQWLSYLHQAEISLAAWLALVEGLEKQATSQNP